MNGCSFQQSFTAKFGLVFVLTLENAFSYRFHFIKATEGAEILLKTVLGIFKIALRLRIGMFLCENQWKF